VVLVVDLGQTRDCIPVIERLLEAAATKVRLPSRTESGDAAPDQSVQVSASIGVTFYPQDDVDADALVRHADQAMYLAKQAGKNRYHLFDIAHDAAMQGRHEQIDSSRDLRLGTCATDRPAACR
jgi:diguanylate cyclase (GGDEF)-like protein